ncbi:MAG: hypothetical protein K6F27_08050 [Ruminococcus sp.]|nr:hypothetical protein [Ruminococcus sp.]
MLKGTSIKLLTFASGQLTEETIDDVLIGEPTSSAPTDQTDGRLLGYTLGIPKGDLHDWTDRLVEFWGKRFRTSGYPQQGIEANIPLRWGKNIKVELVDTSGICTVYDIKTYTKHTYSYVCIRDGRGGTTVAQDGSRVAGRLQVRIYAPLTAQGDYIPQVGDIIIPSACNSVIDTTSEQTVSQSIKALRSVYPQYAAVVDVSRQYYGTKPDIVIEAR